MFRGGLKGKMAPTAMPTLAVGAFLFPVKHEKLYACATIVSMNEQPQPQPQPQPPVPPQSTVQGIPYAHIIEEIKRQLVHRKRALFKRVALTSSPLIITAVLFGSSVKIQETYQLSDTMHGVSMTIAGVALLVSLIWFMITKRIFRIERAIWIDSFFDQVVLTDKESWRLAMGLFFPNIVVSLLIFARYHLVLILIWISVLVLGGFAMGGGGTPDAGILILLIAAVPISFVLLAIYLKIRLRYLTFVFLDTYGTPGFSYNALFKKTREINHATKGDGFKKSLTVALGSDVAEAGVNMAIGGAIGAVSSSLPLPGQAVGQAAGIVASEVTAAYKQYIQETTFYVYYRVGRSMVYGESQFVNNSLYVKRQTQSSF